MTDVTPVTVAPLRPENWDDLVALFGPERGAYSRCWCTWWRLSASRFDELEGADRRELLHERAQQSPPPGVLAYRDHRPVGWIAVAARGEFPRLNRSPLLKAVDDTPVWSITCLYVDRSARRTGVAAQLVRAAVDLAADWRAQVVEAYPHELPSGQRASDASVFMGTPDLFTAAGFTEVTRRRHRVIVRRELTGA